ncbi:hypothetical protein SEA_PINKIEPIE_246 [Streptomyces phage PinkiePie]|nr:hypothetical protein SEA_SQUILLIUM_248 [Streptomyces phage Squillium]WNM73090.1 hypothetical protein SEA_PERSIMMON_248 [Streptomyces phage Persimmon]WNM73466.1 hypothetical protein SEA_LIANDRY_245 [Streptomyces phage Liandry]WNM74868.1 hypothetical protein SEA_PINKIEPIE_246 [Streptomyces phage PinkiePie]
MKRYRIHISLMSGKLIYSDPLDVGSMDHDEIVSHLDQIVEIVSTGGSLTLLLNGQKKTYLNHAIESIWWTDGS